jgi:hypothetical protein
MRFDRKNRYLATDYKAYRDVTENRERFYYRYIVKPYGESDRGDYYPPSLSLDAMYAFRSTRGLTPSIQLYVTAPFGVRWVHSYLPTVYDPHPAPDHRAWDAVISYGMEFSSMRVPLFLGIGLPIHDRSDPKGTWDAPDWEAIGNEWLFALGLRAALF